MDIAILVILSLAAGALAMYIGLMLFLSSGTDR